MTDARATKTCPDCAEAVLEAARKCRFCGYRFDEGARPPVEPTAGAGASPSPLDAVLGMLRRPDQPSATEAELLAEWGIVLEDEEGDPVLGHGSIDGTFGFIVVTSTRFRFIPATSRAKPLRVAEEHSLSDLIRVHRGRHRLRRVLFVEWRGERTILRLDGHQLERLESLLAPHALAPRGSGRQDEPA